MTAEKNNESTGFTTSDVLTPYITDAQELSSSERWRVIGVIEGNTSCEQFIRFMHEQGLAETFKISGRDGIWQLWGEDKAREKEADEIRKRLLEGGQQPS